MNCLATGLPLPPNQFGSWDKTWIEYGKYHLYQSPDGGSSGRIVEQAGTFCCEACLSDFLGYTPNEEIDRPCIKGAVGIHEDDPF